jgi:hypothetical protein
MPAPASFDDSGPADEGTPDVPHGADIEADDEARHGRLAELSGPDSEIPPDSDEQ